MAVAVVGTGFIGPVHVEALRRLNIEVKGILGSSPEKSERAATSLGLQVGYKSYKDILKDKDIDVIHITSPNRHHLQQASDALNAGKHVVCEKPLAMTTKETKELVTLSQKNPNLIAAVNYNVRFYPVVLHAREMIKAGKLGEIYSVSGCYVQDWLLFDTDYNWRVEAKDGGKLRAVGDIGTHWMDLIGFVTGLKTKRLVADLATFIKQRKKPKGGSETFTGKLSKGPKQYDLVNINTEDWGAVLFNYDNGARGVMNVSQTSAGRKNFLNFEICGSKGSVSWNSERPNELWLGYRDKPNEILIKDPSLMDAAVLPYANYPGGHAEGFPDTFKQLYRAIYGYLSAGDFKKPKPFPTFADGHDEVLLCEKILESHKAKKWVNV
jgi:predicted dehydrogenase